MYSQLFDSGSAVHFRRASNTDMLELHRKKGKYWAPQLALTPADKSIPFGPFSIQTFGGMSHEFPVRGSEPAFVSLVFRDAFHDMNRAWASHAFATTTRWPTTARIPPPSLARQQQPTRGAADDLPPAPFFQLFALEGGLGRLMSGMLVRNTRKKLHADWEQHQRDALLTVASPVTPTPPAIATTAPGATTGATTSGATAPSSVELVELSSARRPDGYATHMLRDDRLLAHVGSMDDLLLQALDAMNK
jgi:hypothetical protein